MYTTKNISQLGGRLMKAMYINAPGQVEFRDIDKPVRQKGEVLLKLLYGGICGSDLGSYRGTFAYVEAIWVPTRGLSHTSIIQGYQAMSFLRKLWRWMRTMDRAFARE